jgi:cell fate regulator YaaT (PSP1 superfamily)
MCCLVYESELYHVMKEKLPRDGQRVTTGVGAGKVVGSNPLMETVLVELDESQATVELPLNEVVIQEGQAETTKPGVEEDNKEILPDS